MAPNEENAGDTPMARLDIRSLQMVDAEGHERMRMSVFCHRRRRSLELVECEHCKDFGSVVLEPTGQRSFLVCAGPGGPAAASDAERLSNVYPAVRTPVSTVMCRNLVCVRPDVTVEALAAMFADRGVHAAPVVAEDGRVLGMVSHVDLLLQRAARPGGGTVAEVMKPVHLVLRETAPLTQAAALLAYDGEHDYPVLSEDGKVVGLLCALDLLRWLARQDGYLQSATSIPEPP